MSGAGLYDPTSIMNADTLNKCQVSRCAIHFKFGYLLTWFLVEGGLDKACLLPVGLLLLLVRHDLQPHHRLEPQVQKISLWWYQVNVLYVRRQFLWLTYYNWQTHMKLMSRVWALILRDDCIIILIALKWLRILKVTNQPIFRASPWQTGHWTEALFWLRLDNQSWWVPWWLHSLNWCGFSQRQTLANTIAIYFGKGREKYLFGGNFVLNSEPHPPEAPPDSDYLSLLRYLIFFSFR